MPPNAHALTYCRRRGSFAAFRWQRTNEPKTVDAPNNLFQSIGKITVAAEVDLENVDGASFEIVARQTKFFTER
jgi:hypothetical protein